MTTPIAYLVALVDGGGTVPAELGAVRRLVERGHDVTVLAEDSMEADVRAAGRRVPPVGRSAEPPRPAARARPLPGLGVLEPAPTVRPPARDPVRRSPARATPPTSTAAIAERRPDLVVCSQFAFGAMVAAEAAGIPFDVLMPNIYLLPSPGMTPMGMGVRPARGPLGRARDRLLFGRDPAHVGQGPRPAQRRPCASAGWRPCAHFMDQPHRARRQLVMTSADFDFPGRLPANARYVGPVLDDPAWARHGVDAAARRRAARARRPVVDVPGPRGDAATHRRRPRHVARAGRRHHRPGPRSGGGHAAAPNVTVVAARPHREVLGRRRSGRDPRRPRHGRQGARRRRSAGRAAPRPGPGRQRRPGHRAGCRREAEANGEAAARSPSR